MAEKKYKCPYCEARKIRSELSTHIEEKHFDMIPQGYSPYRVAFNAINKKTHGTCVICKKETKWNEAAGKYNRLCDNPKCKETLRKNYSRNMIKVYNTDNLLKDSNFQQKMLKNRSISGEYKFKDGGKRTYTGSFEKKTLEFFDKVLNVHSDDIMTPGPTFKYEYEGEQHDWITDIYYIPANLIIEVKDGGDNPNNRQMISYRGKQVAKEKMITDMGTFNYLRLTNNNFTQLLSLLAELKDQALSGKEDKAIIRIHENSSIEECMPPAWANDATVALANYKTDPRKEVLFLSDEYMGNNLIFVDADGKFKAMSRTTFANEFTNVRTYSVPKDESYKKLLEDIKQNVGIKDMTYIYEALSGTEDCLCFEEIEFNPKFKRFNMNERLKDKNLSILKESIVMDGIIKLPLFLEEDVQYRDRLIPNGSPLNILQDPNGYFIINTENGLRMPSVDNITSITESDVKFMME